MGDRVGLAFPHNLSPWRQWLWRRLPLRVRARFNPTDNWAKGYLAGFAAGTTHTEKEARGDPPYSDHPCLRCGRITCDGLDR